MTTAFILIASLVAAAIAGTVELITRDGYRRMPTRRA